MKAAGRASKRVRVREAHRETSIEVNEKIHLPLFLSGRNAFITTRIAEKAHNNHLFSPPIVLLLYFFSRHYRAKWKEDWENVLKASQFDRSIFGFYLWCIFTLHWIIILKFSLVKLYKTYFRCIHFGGYDCINNNNNNNTPLRMRFSIDELSLVLLRPS